MALYYCINCKRYWKDASVQLEWRYFYLDEIELKKCPGYTKDWKKVMKAHGGKEKWLN